MTYLITGATGFLGKKLVDLLLASGDSVNYMGRSRSAELDTRAAFHCWNGKDEPPMNAVPRVDAVIHLMGEPVAQRWTAEAKRRIRDSRVESTRQLVSAIAGLRNKPEVLICASAVGYYGDRGNEILTERSPAGTGFLAEMCRDWEREALRAEAAGVRVVTTRISIALGAEGGALSKMLPPFRLGLGGRLGSGKQWMPWIHADDLIALFLYAAEHQTVRGALNGSSPEPVSNGEFTRALARQLHRPAIFVVPKSAINAALGEMADTLFVSIRAIPEAAQLAGFTFRYPQLADALADLLND